MIKTVWAIRIYTTNVLFDFGQEIKNLVGGRLKKYEEITNKAIAECLEELNSKWPGVKNIKITSGEVARGAIEIIAYGEADDRKPPRKK